METRIPVAVLLAVLVGLAGCTGGITGESGTETEGEAALQSTSTTVSNFSYPEGADPSGISSVETLLDEHEAGLDGTSVTLVGNQSFGVEAGSRSDEAGFGYSVAHDADAGTTLTTLGLSNGTLSAYVDGDTQYYRIDNESGREYGTAGPDEGVRDTGPESYTGRELLAGMLGAGDYEATEVVVRNGTELVRYDLQELESTPDNTISGEVQSAESSVFVDADGVVHAANMTISTGFITYEADVRFTAFESTSVEEPDWVARAE